MTLHKLLFTAKPNEDGSYSFTPREELDGDYKVVCIDEVSMVSQAFWDLLMRHPVYVIALGDPGQLSPLSGDQVEVVKHPHIFLDEIMRQAQESEIIRLSMHVREGRPLATFDCQNQDVMILNPWEFTPEMMLWADQCLCAKNETRHKYNAYMRELKGHSGDPKVGEKIIGLTNHWNCCSNDVDKIPLTNGAIGTIISIERSSLRAPGRIFPRAIPTFKVNIETEDGHKFNNLIIDRQSILQGEKLLTPQQEYQMLKAKKCPPPPYDFNYADWISVWKFQGSQADKILLLEENFPNEPQEHIKFIYTGITRAAEKCVIIKK